MAAAVSPKNKSNYWVSSKERGDFTVISADALTPLRACAEITTFIQFGRLMPFAKIINSLDAANFFCM